MKIKFCKEKQQMSLKCLISQMITLKSTTHSMVALTHHRTIWWQIQWIRRKNITILLLLFIKIINEIDEADEANW